MGPACFLAANRKYKVGKKESLNVRPSATRAIG
jgi:hypothetical protein